MGLSTRGTDSEQKSPDETPAASKVAASGRLTLGIDPALGTTGYGLIRWTSASVEVVDAGIVRCRRDRPLEDRLKELYEGIDEIVREFSPDDFAIEELYSHYDRPTTAILMGHARGVILLAARQSGLAVSSYAATKIKKTLTGNGRASKAQMQLAVQHQLRLASLPEPSDVADALAIAMTHIQNSQIPSASVDLLTGSSRTVRQALNGQAVSSVSPLAPRK
ncbi:MAG: crossover junction endodeoxyribonuclease RuvC [Pirellulaceae bacterium]